MSGYETTSASPLKLVGTALVILSLTIIALQAFAWAWTHTWYPVTFRHVLDPLLSVSSIGGWLEFPQTSLRAHGVVTWLLGLPMGLTTFIVGWVMAIDLRRRSA